MSGFRLRAEAVFAPRSMTSGQFIAARVTPGVIASVKAVCEFTVQRAKEMAPVRTGQLRDSIAYSIEELEKTVRGNVFATVAWAAYCEFGTGRAGAASPGAGNVSYSENWPGMAARPYLRPAADEARQIAQELFRSNVAVSVRT